MLPGPASSRSGAVRGLSVICHCLARCAGALGYTFICLCSLPCFAEATIAWRDVCFAEALAGNCSNVVPGFVQGVLVRAMGRYNRRGSRCASLFSRFPKAGCDCQVLPQNHSGVIVTPLRARSRASVKLVSDSLCLKQNPLLRFHCE